MGANAYGQVLDILNTYDASIKYGRIIRRDWDAVTKEGYVVKGYFENGKVTSFFFE